MDDIVIECKEVSCVFNMSTEKVDSLKEYVLKIIKRELMFKEFLALDDITFSVRKGETVGIIGLNGAGKSTLLKIIAGILKPTKGAVTIKGSVSPLIELGAGFDSELTGRENIYLNGALLGYSKEFLNNVYDQIVEFSELGNFIDVPVKNYSSGMYARLGFSIATIVKPQILIIDEVLAVGDFLFQEKCEKKIDELMSGETTVIMVSHSIEQIKRICKRAIWLNNGRIAADGDVTEVCEQYIHSV
ncbi:MAG: ABC transporter ATP-binding protein [Oscillospiraceae bacterium]|nr:ABC transporter ATP-binding protein [Oscillospiraceae bacterium]